MALFGKVLPAVAGLLVASSALGAQAAPARPACDADASKGNLARASLTLEQLRGAQGTPAAQSMMMNAVKQLEAVKGEDPTVHAFLMGQTLAYWLSQPNMSPAPRRSVLGFTQNPEATIDLVATIDSLFKVVETAKPNCAELANAYRGGLPGYLALVNGAITAMNAEKLDSAEYYATAANRLYSASPYGTMVLGGLAAKRGNQAKAVEFWGQAAMVAATDTIYRDVERQVLNNQGSALLDMATGASGAERTTAGRAAIAAFTRLLAVPGTTGAFATSGRKSLQAAQLMIGDTAAFVAGYQPMLASPANYGYQDILNTAVSAALSNRTADAARLFEASLAQNPYSRDALFNLAVVYTNLDQPAKVAALIPRLVAVDPSNPENYAFAAQSYVSLAKAAQTAKRTAAVAALNDTAMTWFNRGNTLPSEVRVSEFIAADSSVTIAGTVLDRRDKVETIGGSARPAARGAKAPAKPALTPAPVTIKVEALDKAGAVLGSQTVTTEPLTPGKTAKFSARIAAQNAVAYRYTIGG